MKRMTTITAIAILITATEIQAGWLSNIGQRIINGAVNTVQTNISGKVNRTIDNAMDGKLGNQPKTEKTNQKMQESYATHVPDTKTTGQPDEVVVESKMTYTSNRDKSIKYTNNYEKIDLGTMSFTGEKIYSKRLSIGQKLVKVEEFLSNDSMNKTLYREYVDQSRMLMKSIGNIFESIDGLRETLNGFSVDDFPNIRAILDDVK